MTVGAAYEERVYQEALPLYLEYGSVTEVKRRLPYGDVLITRVLKEHGVQLKSQPRRKGIFPVQPLVSLTQESQSNLARQFGKGVVQRWYRKGLDLDEADNVACHYGWLPQEVWDGWWDEVDRALGERDGAPA